MRKKKSINTKFPNKFNDILSKFICFYVFQLHTHSQKTKTVYPSFHCFLSVFIFSTHTNTQTHTHTHTHDTHKTKLKNSQNTKLFALDIVVVVSPNTVGFVAGLFVFVGIAVVGDKVVGIKVVGDKVVGLMAVGVAVVGD